MAPQQAREIVRQRVSCAGYPGARDKIEKAGGASRDFPEALVIRSRSREKNGVEILRVDYSVIILGLFRRQIGDEHAVGSGQSRGSCKLLEPHLQDGIEISEENQRHLAGLANPANQFEDTGE